MNRTILLLSVLALAPTISAAQAQPARPPAQASQPAQGTSQSDQDHTAHHPADSTATPGAAAPGTASPSAPAQTGSPGMGMMGGDMPAMMNQMMPMMRAMMNRQGMDRWDGPMGMMAPRRVEGRIAFLKAELQITEAQLPAWNAFADALRVQARDMEEMRGRMMGGQMQGMPMAAGPQPPGAGPGRPMPGSAMQGQAAPSAPAPGGAMPAQPPAMPMPGSPTGGGMAGAGMMGGGMMGGGMMGGGMMGMGGSTPAFPEQADRLVQSLSARLEAARAIATAGRALYAVLSDAQKQTADELLIMPMRRM